MKYLYYDMNCDIISHCMNFETNKRYTDNNTYHYLNYLQSKVYLKHFTLDMIHSRKISNLINNKKYQLRKEYIELVLQDIIKAIYTNQIFISNFAPDELKDVKIYCYSEFNQLDDDRNYSYANKANIPYSAFVPNDGILFLFMSHCVCIDFISKSNEHCVVVNKDSDKVHEKNEDKLYFGKFMKENGVKDIDPAILITMFNYFANGSAFIEECKFSCFDKFSAQEWISSYFNNYGVMLV